MQISRIVLPTLLSLVVAAPVLANDVDPKPRAIKARAFASGKAGFYTSILGKPYLMTHAKYSGINRRLELNKKVLASMNAENNYGVLKETKLCHAACIKDERKYTGGHKTALGENMREMLISMDAIERNVYSENPIVELYEQEVPMYWQMRTADEFGAVRESFVRRMEEKLAEPQKHAVLLVTIEDDPTLATLNPDDNEFIQEWFTQVSFEDSDSREYFGTMYEKMNKQNYQLEGAKPEWPFETATENLFRRFEKALGQFESDDLITTIAASFGATFLATSLTCPFNDAVKSLARMIDLRGMANSVASTGGRALERTGIKNRALSAREDIAGIGRGIHKRFASLKK